MTLTEPEDRLLAEIAVGIIGCDVHQLVDGVAVAPLREDEDELILNVGLALHLVVEADELPQIGAALTGPEEGVLPRFDGEGPVAGEIDEPAHRFGRMRLRHRLDDAALDLIVMRTGEELAEKAHVVGVAVRLAEPEDGLGASVRGFALISGDTTERRIGALVARLGEREDRLAEDVVVRRVRRDRIEG